MSADQAGQLQYIVPLSSLSIIIVAANTMVCTLVYKYKNMRSYTNGFVVSLAVSDILTGGLVLPFNIAHVNSIVQGYLVSIVLISGVGNLCGVTLDRYLAVTRPFQYPYFISKWFYKVIAACWLLPLLISLLPLLWRGAENARIYSIYTICLVVFGIIVPYFCIFAAYYRIFKYLRTHNRRLSSVITSRRFRSRTLAVEAKVSKVFVIVAVMFVFSWFPVIYMTLAYEVSPTLIPNSLYTVSIFTIAVGSLGNPILYAFMKPDYKNALIRGFRRSSRSINRTAYTVSWRMSTRGVHRIPANSHSTRCSLHLPSGTLRHNSLARSLTRGVIERKVRRNRSNDNKASTVFDAQRYDAPHSPTFHFINRATEDRTTPSKQIKRQLETFASNGDVETNCPGATVAKTGEMIGNGRRCSVDKSKLTNFALAKEYQEQEINDGLREKVKTEGVFAWETSI